MGPMPSKPPGRDADVGVWKLGWACAVAVRADGIVSTAPLVSARPGDPGT